MTVVMSASNQASERFSLPGMLSASEILAPKGERGALFGAQTTREQRSGTPQNQSETASPGSATLRSAVRLLAEARRALSSNKDEADQWIAKAAAILQAESDNREMDARNAPASHRHQLAPWQVARVVRFVDANLSKKMAIPSLAAITRLSSGHFTRAFRATVGEPPYAYVIRRRIERAQELILLTEKPLSEVALDCGFSDQAHMTRLFRRVVGVSPGVWRRAHGTAAVNCELIPGALPSPRHMLADTNDLRPAIAVNDRASDGFRVRRIEGPTLPALRSRRRLGQVAGHNSLELVAGSATTAS